MTQKLAALLGLAGVATVLTLANAKDLPPDTMKRKDAILKRFHGEFVQLEPGKAKFAASFRMGSGDNGADNEKPAHLVTFKKPFSVCKYEVTQELYFVIMGKNPSKWKGPRNSVEMVAWSEANEFCQKATDELRKLKLLGDDEVIRLPSEAEWEYACRAGSKTRFSCGDDEKVLDKHAWYGPNSKGFDPPVGEKLPNAWGLHDMHGYVWEWCADYYHPDYQEAPSDGSAWTKPETKTHVIRGGSFADPADAVRSAARRGEPDATRTDKIGFRCVLDKK